MRLFALLASTLYCLRFLPVDSNAATTPLVQPSNPQQQRTFTQPTQPSTPSVQQNPSVQVPPRQKQRLSVRMPTNNDFHIPGKVSDAIIRIWPNGVIPYAIYGTFTQEHIALIQSVDAELQKDTGIVFNQISPNSSTVHLKINISTSTANAGVASVGYNGNNSFCNITSGITRRILLHELTHVIGLIHEHSRADRDNYITIHKENMNGIKEDDLAKFSKVPLVEEYDYYSIMHYEVCHLSVDPNCRTNFSRPSITPKQQGIDWSRVGRAEKLSEKDIAKVKYLYQSKST